MHITWHGQYTVKIQSGDKTLVLDPYAPSVGLAPFKAKADIVALTNPSEPESSHLGGLQGEPRVLSAPGEYAINGFTLHALGWYDQAGNERNLQRWQIEGLTLLHVGGLNRELSDHELQELERTTIDILLVPVGGGEALSTKEALAFVTTIEPRIVIPIHFNMPKLKEKLDDVGQFAKEMGVSPPKFESKLTIKAKGVPQEEVATVLLMP